MKQFSKTLLASAVAVGLCSGAFAATVNNPTSGTTYGKNIVNETNRAIVSPVATVVTLAAGESLSVDDSITFTLSSGATFAAVVAGDLTAAPNTGPAAFALVAGGVGESFATFRITNNPTDPAAVLTLAATATFNGTAVPNNGDIQVTVDMSGFVGGAQTSLFGSPLGSLNTNLVPMQTATVTPSGGRLGTFDVAAGFQQFTAGTSSDAAAPFNSSLTATVTVTTDPAAVANSTTAGVPTGAPTLANTIFTVSGPMAKLTSIGATGGITSSTATGGTPTGGTTANALFIDEAMDMAYGIATAAGPYAFTINVDEEEVHEVSNYNIDVTRTTDPAGYSATTVLSNGDLFFFGRNGSAFSSNSIGPANKVSVSDRSGAIGAGGADGAIAITAYDTDGNEIACSPSIPNLPNNGTVVFDGTDITDACPGAKRIEGVVNSTRIIVTNTKTNANGTTTAPGLAASGGTAGI